VSAWLYHWIYLDAWVPIWPNLAASLVVYIFVYLKMRSLAKVHEELKTLHIQHHREQMQAIENKSGTP